MSRIVLNRLAVHHSGRQRGQEAARELSTRVLVGAKTLVRRGTHRHGSGRPVAGSTLLASLQSVRISSDPYQIIYDIGSPKEYAATVHQGSKPHRIEGRGKPLSFYWPRARYLSRSRRLARDPRVAFWSVRHPGNKRPNRFLTTPLQQFGRAANFRVRTVNATRGFLP